MNKKTRHGIWLVAGGYLGYTGISLIMQVMKEKPDHYIGFVAAGVIFTIFGVAVAIRSIKGLMEPNEEETDEEGTPEGIEEQEEMEETVKESEE